ncbi:DUF1345 domain-containing protein [Moellerella wisconsensis]|uniref:DUF1345 domain-containing protein n=3 Tax=Gammaproteobacteria TaxID=1236 RepID=A0A9Q8PZ80_9GAMM|nr:DUF1345 domain-containing protein [Moellerella wisconsensis]KLN95862.1 membrane protein [Moellerella wisconsensis]UNH22962.1 DUF1345 domain-containing protein [Moellerella wisconsensis]UNH26101.1 DUF1345 domain-containing protein [Moellerella wisconsensis]UNH29515.1 DUF1345 domain-containing protein [Moellerella wisconsensis]UNH37654.1 DUF1345 domain-containing protein [Moellerella wisconsensis]
MFRLYTRFTHIAHHYFHSRPRLLLSLGAAIITFFILLSYYPVQTGLMLSWNVFAWLYLACLLEKTIIRKKIDIRKVTRREDESAKMVIFFLLAGCCISMLVLFVELSGSANLKGYDRIFSYLLTASTLISSWLLIPMGFTMHYAHLYYGRHEDNQPWLIFPDKPNEPMYSDFMYFSFTIAVASQTADVCVGSSMMRKAVLLQSVLSFIFNMAILGLSINICASLF